MQAESTKLEYDFENIQAVLQDKILFGKIIIDTSSDVSRPLKKFLIKTSCFVLLFCVSVCGFVFASFFYC